MASTVYSTAHTTPLVRRELQEAPPSVNDAELARRYGIPRMTLFKCRYRKGGEDGSRCPQRHQTTLAREFLNPKRRRAAVARCLRQHGVGDLRSCRGKGQESSRGRPTKRSRTKCQDWCMWT